jgi:hypothetical protein
VGPPTIRIARHEQPGAPPGSDSLDLRVRVVQRRACDSLGTASQRPPLDTRSARAGVARRSRRSTARPWRTWRTSSTESRYQRMRSLPPPMDVVWHAAARPMGGERASKRSKTACNNAPLSNFASVRTPETRRAPSVASVRQLEFGHLTRTSSPGR